MTRYYVGVDGGATKTIVRMEDVSGQVIGIAKTGPATIRFSPQQAWQTIHAGIATICEQAQLPLAALLPETILSVGLAGHELVAERQVFIAHVRRMVRELLFFSDAHIACVGAHGGRDGQIILVGTGVIGWQVVQQTSNKVGGWGFPHDDIGGGAWLGLQAISLTLQGLDGRASFNPFCERIYQHFAGDLPQLLNFANHANPTMFAELAPLVIALAAAQDETAIRLLQQAALAITEVYRALTQQAAPSILPCALLGGLAPFIQSYLDPQLQQVLVAPQFSPDRGAVLLAKQARKNGDG